MGAGWGGASRGGGGDGEAAPRPHPRPAGAERGRGAAAAAVGRRAAGLLGRAPLDRGRARHDGLVLGLRVGAALGHQRVGRRLVVEVGRHQILCELAELELAVGVDVGVRQQVVERVVVAELRKVPAREHHHDLVLREAPGQRRQRGGRPRCSGGAQTARRTGRRGAGRRGAGSGRREATQPVLVVVELPKGVAQLTCGDHQFEANVI